jgi:hypothetical protein
LVHGDAAKTRHRQCQQKDMEHALIHPSHRREVSGEPPRIGRQIAEDVGTRSQVFPFANAELVDTNS